jgi:hypothetical protein
MGGMLQVAARLWRREDLRWLPRSLAVPVGVALTLGAGAWFYLSYYQLIFVPGPAGLELIVLFAAATALAVWGTRILYKISSLVTRQQPAGEAGIARPRRWSDE